ncbi:unnamed protein product [Adineta steineri]|uniref:Uncharacterized protein n=1 Tax=Adineta steineri TaxID=433720 RepID=A0A819WIS8_9BILA|nr:unnamed protein product [Adineta steineri]CAF4195327.1 unnamed protein product [Adineta steineri]
MDAVENSDLIRAAFVYYNVSYTTLTSHSNNLVLYHQVGRPPKFNKEEELCLEQATLALQGYFLFFFMTFLTFFNKKNWGAALTINEFINLAKQYASSVNKSDLFPSNAPTCDWFYSFL